MRPGGGQPRPTQHRRPRRARLPARQTSPSAAAWDSKAPLGRTPPTRSGDQGVPYLPEQGAVDAGRAQGRPGALQGDLGEGPGAGTLLLPLLAGGHRGVEELCWHGQKRVGGLQGEGVRGCCWGERRGSWEAGWGWRGGGYLTT